MSLEAHRAASPDCLSFAVVTVSDTRDQENDHGGDYLVQSLSDAGHRVGLRAWVSDDAVEIEAAARRAVLDPAVDLVLFTGGTGIAPRDVTAPTLEALFESSIPGFGELFRALSHEEIGSATILSRATAGLLERKVLIALPGSPKALRLAMERIVLPEAGHLVTQARG